MFSKEFRANMLKHKLVGFLSSLKLTVACLFILALLTFFGTLDQVENGLYLAQQKFFNSYFLFIGPVPLPSARTVLWVFALNLITVLLFRFNFSWKNFGINISHFGLLLLLFSGFLTLNFSHESFVELTEGERTNQAYDYQKWELLLVKADQEIVFSDREFKSGTSLSEEIHIKDYYINSAIFETPFAGLVLKELDTEKKYEKNLPALRLQIQGSDDIVELQALSQPSARLNVRGIDYLLRLRRKEYKLPFSIELNNVERELHLGTDKAKSYHSEVTMHEAKYSRDLTIAMNKPFRSGLYTVYQSSYGVNEDGNEVSVFAVVKNLNYWLPYVATVIASLGLFIYFAGMMVNRKS